MAGRGSFPNFLAYEYDQMKDDYHNPELNSYDVGPGSLLRDNLPKDGANTKLYVSNIPCQITEEGLLHIFSCDGETPESVYIHRKHNQQANTNWGFVTFKTIAAASNAMVAIHKKPPYNFYVHFARINDDEKSNSSKDRHSIEDKESIDKSLRDHNFPSSRGRGKLPPMRGLPPSKFKAISSKDEPYIDDLGDDYSPGRFSHCGISYEQNVSNSIFSPFAEGEYDDGKRKMTMGRGSYIASNKKQPVEAITEELQDMEQRVAAYLGNKTKNFLFDNDAFISSETKLSLPMKPGYCSYCSRPAIYVCSKCKCWYCTNYCRKMDWNVHKNICVPRLLKFHDGSPVYENISDTPHNGMNKRNSNGKHPVENHNKSKDYSFFKSEGSDRDQSGHESSVSNEDSKNFAADNNKSSIDDQIKKESKNRNRRGRHRGKQSGKKVLERSYKSVETDVCIKGPAAILSSRIAAKSQENKVSHPAEPPIPWDVFTKVTIGAVGRGNEFHAFKVDDYMKQANIMTKLGEHIRTGKISCAKIKIGTRIIAQFEGDWFRAEVTSIQEDIVQVKFIDFGNEALIMEKELKTLPEELAKEPPLAHKFVLADSSNNPKLEGDMTIAVKPVSQDPRGVWIVQVEGVKYSEKFEKLNDGTTVCKVEGNDCQTDRQMKHFLSFLQNNDVASLVIGKVMNEEFLTGTIIIKDELSVFQEISSIINEEVVPDKETNLTPGKMLAAKWKGNWYRGYLMVMRDKNPVVALIDKGVVVIPDHVAELPQKVMNIPECGVRVIFENPILNKNMAGETFDIKNICHDRENNHLHGEIEDFGKVIILPWVPAIEEAGLDCVKISSGSKVQLSAYHSPSAIYVQPCDPTQWTIRSELLQDVASCTKGQPLKRKPLIGEFLACRYVEDGNYYRAQVFSKEGGKYKVNFVDYGNTELVSLSEMKQLPEHLKRIPCCAVKVGLKNVPNVPFNTQCMKFLNELAAYMTELFITYEKDLREVTLEMREGDNINNVLFSFLEPSWNKPNYNPHSSHVFMASEIKYEVWNKGDQFEMVAASVIRHDTVLALRPSSGLLNHVERTLTPMITKYCESQPNEPYNPRRSELCLARFHEDEKWYRALCLKSYQHNAAEVFYFDYGNSGEVLHRCIRKMVPEFMEPPAVLKCCRIYGIPEKVSEPVSSKLMEYLSTLKAEVEVLEDVGEGDCVVRIPALESYASQLGIHIKHPKSV